MTGKERKEAMSITTMRLLFGIRKMPNRMSSTEKRTACNT